MKSTSNLFISEQSQWDRCRLNMRVAVMKVSILLATILLSATSLSAQAAPSMTTSSPDLIPTLGVIPKAPTPRSEAVNPAQATKPAQMKAGRVHAILGQWHGSSYSGGEFSVTKIYGASHWHQFWQAYLKRKEPCDFDESLHQAVYIELGVRPAGGYAINVMSVYEEDNQLIIEYVEHEPAPDQYVTQALTTPWVMVLLPRTDLRVVTRKASGTGKE